MKILSFQNLVTQLLTHILWLIYSVVQIRRYEAIHLEQLLLQGCFGAFLEAIVFLVDPHYTDFLFSIFKELRSYNTAPTFDYDIASDL